MNYDRRFYLLLFFAIALVAAEAYLYSGVRSLNGEAEHIRSSLVQDISALREKTTETAAADRERVDRALQQIEEAKRESALAALAAKYQAQARAEHLAAEIARRERYQREDVAEQLGRIKADTVEANRKIGDLGTDIQQAKNVGESARSEASRSATELAAIRSRLDDLNGLIARNHDELQDLRARAGDREFTEFSLQKSKQPQNVGGLQLTLKKTDPKRNVYSIVVVKGGVKIEENDRSVDEPVRLAGGPERARYQIVVNQVEKDRVSGYVAAIRPVTQAAAPKPGASDRGDSPRP